MAVAVVAERDGCRRGRRAGGFAGVGMVGESRRMVAGAGGGCLLAVEMALVCLGLGVANRVCIGLLAAVMWSFG